MTVIIISEFDIRDELEKLEPGTEVQFITGDYVFRQPEHYEYYRPSEVWYDQQEPEIIQDKEIIIDSVLKNALKG